MRLQDLTNDQWEFIIEKVEPQEQGIHVYYKGVPYPRRVYKDWKDEANYFLRALDKLGIVKKFLFSLTYLLPVVIPRTLSLKKYDQVLIKFGQLCNWQLGEFFIKDNQWSVPVWEMGKFVKNLLEELGFSENVCDIYWKVTMCILEYDNAYRYRIQDLLGEVFYLDRSSLEYISKLYKQREGLPGAAEKLERLLKLLKLLLFIPKFRKALERAHYGVDFEKIKLDINDRYYVSYWRGYDYFGQDFDTRYQFFLDTHKGDFPPFRKRQDPMLTIKFLTE